jgi:PDZ domain-containing protein
VSRRIRTLLIGGVLLIVLAVLAVTLHVPYVVLTPGPTLNTLGKDDHGNSIIVIKGHAENSTSGHLNLMTVDVTTSDVTVLQALSGWLKHDEVVVPRDSVYPPGQSTQQTNQQNTQDFVQSQDSAQAAAFCELGYPSGLQVVALTDGSTAKGALQAGDQLLSFNGTPVSTADGLTSLLAADAPGSTASVGISRGGTKQTVSVPLVAAGGGAKGARMGISIQQGCIAPFQVDLGLANEIGGPSAGMMFALGILDKVGSQDLTRGKFIAGTGTIDAAGKVGPIGGIQLKMIAASRAGASVFLAPSGNCSAVLGETPKGLDVVKVDTLHGAVQDLLDLQQGRPVPHC